MKKTNQLLAVEEVKITIIMDNSVDAFMTGNKIVHRFNMSSASLIAKDDFSNLIAEHGFSAIIEVKRGGKTGTVLLDTGISPNGILHNMNTLGISVKDIQAIILSHGHVDHTMGLPNIIERLDLPVPLVFHPDAFLDRKIIMPGGCVVDVSAPKLTVSQKKKVIMVNKRGRTLIADGMVLISGEIPRITDFETGFPPHYTKREGIWENDPLVKDDQCVIINVYGKGLVIITGCCHSGLINTIKYAQKLTGCTKVYAVLGGFHLTGGIFEKIIPRTINKLQQINPSYLMPGHCTGTYAINQIELQMPEVFIPSNVGTTLVFGI